MKRLLLALPAVVAFVLLFACQARIAELENIRNAPVRRSLSLDELGAAIHSGVVREGWRAKKISDNEILAMHKYRNHRVIVAIDFSEDGYSIIYRNSLNMKVVCSADSAFMAQSVAAYVVTTGEDPCPYGAPPQFIHEKYNEWVQQLNRSISRAIYASSPAVDYKLP